MFLLQQALPGLLVAALLSGVVAFAGRLWRANNWGDAVALAMGYAGGHAVTIGWPPFPASTSVSSSLVDAIMNLYSPARTAESVRNSQ